jgi:hypothetical protein
MNAFSIAVLFRVVVLLGEGSEHLGHFLEVAPSEPAVTGLVEPVEHACELARLRTNGHHVAFLR